MKRLLFALLLLAGAAWSAGCIENATDTILIEQGTGIAAAVGVTIVAIALAYVFGSVTGDQHATVFAKDELFHLGFSIALLLGFSAIVVLSCNAMEALIRPAMTQLNVPASGCFSPDSGPQVISLCYLKKIDKEAKSVSIAYVNGYVSEMMASSYSVGIQFPLLNSYTATSGAYRRIKATQYDTILNMFLVPAMMSIAMQKLVLTFITENVMTWILPIGFLLRVIPPTRQMGNILIALSMALYILVPFMYAVNLLMYDVVKPPGLCDFVADSAGGYSPGGCYNPTSLSTVGKLMLQAFFLPNLTIAIVITFLTSLNKALKVIG